MASKHKIGPGKWEVRWRHAGRQRSRVANSAHAAAQLLREVQEAEDLGRDWRPGGAIPPFDTAATEWLADCRRAGLADNTLTSRAVRCDAFVAWGRLHLRREPSIVDLDRPLMAAWHTHLIAEKFKPSSAMTYVRTVEAAWKWVSEHDTYADLVKRPRPLAIAAPAGLAPYAPTWQQADAAVNAAHKVECAVPGFYGRLFEVMRATGIRGEQAAGLLWSDLDLATGLLTIRPELGKTRAEKRGRVIPVAPCLLAAVAGWGRREGFLVPGTDRRVAHHKVLVRIWKTTGYRPPQPRHAFRRCFMTALRSAGVELDLVYLLVGQKVPGQSSTYIPAGALLEQLRAAVAHVPAVGATTAATDVFAARSVQAAAKDVTT